MQLQFDDVEEVQADFWFAYRGYPELENKRNAIRETFFLPLSCLLSAKISLFIRTTWLFKLVRRLTTVTFNAKIAVKKIKSIKRYSKNSLNMDLFINLTAKKPSI